MSAACCWVFSQEWKSSSEWAWFSWNACWEHKRNWSPAKVSMRQWSGFEQYSHSTCMKASWCTRYGYCHCCNLCCLFPPWFHLPKVVGIGRRMRKNVNSRVHIHKWCVSDFRVASVWERHWEGTSYSAAALEGDSRRSTLQVPPKDARCQGHNVCWATQPAAS